MKFHLIYPKWEKLQGQTTFHLPPHGPVVFAATLPDNVEVVFTDENVETLAFDENVDFVGISMMLTTQVKRGWEIAETYRKLGKKVIFGGIATMLHAEETMQYGDAVFLGEAEGKMDIIFNDFKNNALKKKYDFLNDLPDVALIGSARRDILKDHLYYHKGTRMVDLFHASRGCRYDCYPCAVAYLGGRKFRPRPIDKAIEEMAGIDNNRLFIVDNSLACDTQWEKDLFKEMIPLKKNWCSHTIEDKHDVLDLAAQAGAWYVYQAVFDTSDYIRERVKRYHDHGIAVEGTILLGLDDQTEDSIKRLIDFLLEIELDLAEFTVLTPFPHTRAYTDLLKQNRITSFDWNNYNAGKVVYQPKNMTADKLQELYHLAWNTFYEKESQNEKMFKLFMKVINKEIDNGVYKPRSEQFTDRSFGKKINRA